MMKRTNVDTVNNCNNKKNVYWFSILWQFLKTKLLSSRYFYLLVFKFRKKRTSKKFSNCLKKSFIQIYLENTLKVGNTYLNSILIYVYSSQILYKTLYNLCSFSVYWKKEKIYELKLVINGRWQTTYTYGTTESN